MQIKQSTESCSRRDSQRIIILQKEGIYKLNCRNSLGFEGQKNRAFEIRLKEYIKSGKVNLLFARWVIYRNDIYSKTANIVEIRYTEMWKQKLLAEFRSLYFTE